MSRDLFTTPIPTKEDLEKKELETASKILVTLKDLKDYCKSFKNSEGCKKCLLYDRAEEGCVFNYETPCNLKLPDKPTVKISVIDF